MLPRHNASVARAYLYGLGRLKQSRCIQVFEEGLREGGELELQAPVAAGLSNRDVGT